MTKRDRPSSIDVFHWPEFEAFAKRLGIPDLRDLPTQIVIITLDCESEVVVKHQYLGQDMTEIK